MLPQPLFLSDAVSYTFFESVLYLLLLVVARVGFSSSYPAYPRLAQLVCLERMYLDLPHTQSTSLHSHGVRVQGYDYWDCLRGLGSPSKRSKKKKLTSLR